MKPIHLVARYFRDLGYRVSITYGDVVRVSRRRGRSADMRMRGLIVEMRCIKANLSNPDSFNVLHGRIRECFNHKMCNWCKYYYGVRK